MSIAAWVQEVRVVAQGSSLVADAALGATTLYVADVTGFDTAGGLVMVADTGPYTYANPTPNPAPDGSDDPSGSITITPGLTAAAAAPSLVCLTDGVQTLDDVMLDLVDGNSVAVGYGNRKDWAGLEGPVDPPIKVLVSEDYEQVFDAPGYTPEITARVAQLVTDTPPNARLDLSTVRDNVLNVTTAMLRFFSGAKEGDDESARMLVDSVPGTVSNGYLARPRLRILGALVPLAGGDRPELQFLQQIGSGTRGQIFAVGNLIPDALTIGGVGARQTGWDYGESVTVTSASDGMASLFHSLGATPAATSVTQTSAGGTASRQYRIFRAQRDASKITILITDSVGVAAPNATVTVDWQAWLVG